MSGPVDLKRLGEFINMLVTAAQRTGKPKLQDFVKKVKVKGGYIKAEDFANLSSNEQATFALLVLVNSEAYKIKLVDSLNGVGALAIFFHTNKTTGFAYNTQQNTLLDGMAPSWRASNYTTYTYDALNVLNISIFKRIVL